MRKTSRVNLRVFQQELAARLSSKTKAQIGAARVGVISAGQHWLIRLSDSGEVLPVPHLAPVPLTKPWYLGLANVRGSLFGVVDFAGFLGKEPTSTGFLSRLLLLGQRFSELRTGLLVQQVVGLRNLSDMKIADGVTAALAWTGESWRDEAGTLWQELDISRLVQDPRFLTVAL